MKSEIRNNLLTFLIIGMILIDVLSGRALSSSVLQFAIAGQSYLMTLASYGTVSELSPDQAARDHINELELALARIETATSTRAPIVARSLSYPSGSLIIKYTSTSASSSQYAYAHGHILGSITAIDTTFSRINLYLTPNATTSVSVGPETNIVLTGTHAGEGIVQIPHEIIVAPGALVTDTYGHVVGEVAHVDATRSDPTQTLLIRLPFSLGRLTEVVVD